MRRLITEDFDKVFGNGIDVLLTPTTLGDAPKYQLFSQSDNRARTQEQDIYTQPINMAGKFFMFLVYDLNLHRFTSCLVLT